MSGEVIVKAYPSRWRSQCIGLSLECEGFYIRLATYLLEDRSRSIVSSDPVMAKLIAMHTNQYRKVRSELVAHGLMQLTLSEWSLPRLMYHFEYASDGVRLPAGEWSLIRQAVFERDGFTCRYCGVFGGHLECDHVVPVARGGSHHESNLVTSCRACNRSKRDKIVTIAEWQAERGGQP